MESNIAKEINGRFDPIVLIRSDEKPEDAIAPRSSRGGCVMAFVAQTIANRKTTAFGREHASCGGVWSGFGWGDGFNSEADLEFQATFLSLGVDSAKDKDAYSKRLERMPAPAQEMFRHGERIYSDFDTACYNIKNRPIYDEGKYIVFKAIESLEVGQHQGEEGEVDKQDDIAGKTQAGAVFDQQEDKGGGNQGNKDELQRVIHDVEQDEVELGF